MLKLFRMDLHRLFHRKTLYVLIVAMSAITLSMLFLSDPSGMTIGSVMGVLDGVDMNNFMSAASGLGLVYTMICILLSFFVCDDFSSGFAKNLFTVHANKRDYIASKILSTMVASGVMMLISTVEAVAFCMISGIEVGSIGGIVVFFLEKWLLSAPFSAAILFISLWARNKGLGFLFACLLGTGGLVMGISWAFEVLHVPYASQILSWTMYGASTVPALQFQFGDLLHVAAAAVIWSVVYGALSAAVLKKKDIA